MGPWKSWRAGCWDPGADCPEPTQVRFIFINGSACVSRWDVCQSNSSGPGCASLAQFQPEQTGVFLIHSLLPCTHFHNARSSGWVALVVISFLLGAVVFFFLAFLWPWATSHRLPSLSRCSKDSRVGCSVKSLAGQFLVLIAKWCYLHNLIWNGFGLFASRAGLGFCFRSGLQSHHG